MAKPRPPQVATITPARDDDDVLLELARTALTGPVVGPSAERLAALEAKVHRAVAHGRAEATLRAYASDWADFATWCHVAGLDALPATAGTVAGYVSELAFPDHDRDPAAVSTITRRLAAIGQIHSLARQPNPGTTPWSARPCAACAEPSGWPHAIRSRG